MPRWNGDSLLLYINMDPWEDAGPREYKFNLGVLFAAWILGLLLTGAVGMGTVFLLAANGGEAIGWAHVVFGLAMLAGGGTVGGLLESPDKRRLFVGVVISWFGILVPAVGILLYFYGPGSAVLGVTGAVCSLVGVWVGGWVTAYARRMES